MAITIGDSLKYNSSVPSIDSKYGPYASVDAAYDVLYDANIICVGLTVGIYNDDKTEITEYWFNGGTALENLVEKISAEVTVDSELSESSPNAIANSAVTAGLSGKQDTLTFDDTPTENSTNPVTSGGIYTAISNVTVPVDTALSSESTNAISNKAVTTGLATKQDTLSGVSTNDTSNFYVIDASGNVILLLDGSSGELKVDKITSGTMTADSFVMSDGSSVGGLPLSKWEMFTVGDSLCAGGTWQTRVAEKTGITFRSDLNSKVGNQISTGGTTSGGNSMTCGVWRTKRLIDSVDDDGIPYLGNDGGKNKVVIFENINDDNVYDYTLDFETYPSRNPEIYATISSSEFTTDGLAALWDETKVSLSSCIQITATGNGFTFTVNSAPGADGTFDIYVNGSGNIQYTISVLSTDTAADIAAKIQEYDYSNAGAYAYISDDDSSTVIFGSSAWSSTSSASSCLVIRNQSSITLDYAITNTTSAKITRCYVYYGSELTQDAWTTTSNWSTAGFNFTMAMKTQIEMIQRNYPYAIIVLASFPRYGLSTTMWENANYFKRDDGTLDMEAWRSTVASNGKTNTVVNEERYTAYKTLAEYYNCYAVDVYGKCGINLQNFTEFFDMGNVHPKTAGYYRLGDVVAAYLTSILLKEGE